MPKVGDGDIGSILPNRDDLLFFASGVSNSQCVDEAEYQRELDLLLEQPRASHIVYFSSLAIFYLDSRYARHKRDMETTIKINFPKNTIIRIGNIEWGDNPHTLINYLRDRIKNNSRYEVVDTHRYVISKQEFLHWIDLIPEWTCEMNCPGRFTKVQQIVDEIKKGEL
jgi:UDP-2-acetamido-2,6-beta-L-arabino-hexul-4-ose reductase